MAKHEKAVRQAAVIAMRQGQICLITSSSGKRWLLPKGHLEQGEDLQDTARHEAWEEAGVLGRLRDRPVGRYRFHKLIDRLLKQHEMHLPTGQQKFRQWCEHWMQPDLQIAVAEIVAGNPRGSTIPSSPQTVASGVALESHAAAPAADAARKCA